VFISEFSVLVSCNRLHYSLAHHSFLVTLIRISRYNNNDHNDKINSSNKDCFNSWDFYYQGCKEVIIIIVIILNSEYENYRLYKNIASVTRFCCMSQA